MQGSLSAQLGMATAAELSGAPISRADDAVTIPDGSEA